MATGGFIKNRKAYGVGKSANIKEIKKKVKSYRKKPFTGIHAFARVPDYKLDELLGHAPPPDIKFEI